MRAGQWRAPARGAGRIIKDADENGWPRSWPEGKLPEAPHWRIRWTTYEEPLPARFGFATSMLVEMTAEEIDEAGRRKLVVEGKLRRFGRPGPWMLALRRVHCVVPVLRISGVRSLARAKRIALEFVLENGSPRNSACQEQRNGHCARLRRRGAPDGWRPCRG